MKARIVLISLLIIVNTCWCQVPGSVRHIYTVTIGTNIRASLWLTGKEDALFGEILYAKGKSPIAVRGTRSGQQYQLYEFAKNGSITGVMTGVIDDQQISGEWFSPGSKKTFRLVCKKTQTLNSSQTLISTNTIGGTYAYRMGKDGQHGVLAVTVLNGDSANIEFNNVSSGPAYNTATIEPLLAPVKDNQIILKPAENCSIRIRFIYDFVIVDYFNGESVCGFGLNVGVDGIYVKTGR